jgi:hypothetical protein
MIKELSLVVLNKNIPEHSLLLGDVGTVVHIYPESQAFEVEFVTGLGKTIAVLTLTSEDVRPVASEILHVRSIAKAA